MTSQLFTSFRGLDLRESGVLADPRSAAVASNLSLTTANEYTTRPGTRLLAELPVNDTVGLYAFNGRFRCVAAGGTAGLTAKQPPGFLFDFIGDGASYTGKLKGFANADIFGQGVFDTQPYLAVLVQQGTRQVIEHHWVTDKQDTVDAAVDSRVNLPFVPSGGIVRAAQKVFALCNADGSMHYSSTLNGPRDWTTEDDAGSVPVVQHVRGGREMFGLSQFENQVAVWFEDAVQLWAVDPNPLNFYLTRVMEGPGCLNPRATANLAGDLVYLSRGGIRALARQAEQSGRREDTAPILREGDIGASIFPAVKLLSASGATMLWSPRRSQLLVSFGATIYAYTYSPMDRIAGWTRWDMPWTVTDLAENQGVLAARTTTGAVYEFDDDLDEDEGYGLVDWEFRSHPLSMKSPGRFKRFQHVELHQEGSARLSLLPSTGGEITGPIVTGAALPFKRVPIQVLSDAVAIKLTGEGAWTLDGFTITFEQGRG